jgi:hypothetical protein
MFGANQEVYTTLHALDASAPEIKLVLKAQGTGACELLSAWYRPSRGSVRIETCHNTTIWTQHGTDLPVTFVAGDRFGARAKADGTVEVSKNGTLVGSRTVAASWPYRANGGRIGGWLNGTAGTILDDVGGGSLS